MSERDEAKADETQPSGADETQARAATPEAADAVEAEVVDAEAVGADVVDAEVVDAEAVEAEAVDAAPEAEPVEPEAVPEPEPDPLAELQGKYDEVNARLRTVSKAYRDLQAEMTAFRERMEARSKVNSELQAFDQARRFFDPVMNLKRSLQQPGDDFEAFKQGLGMVQRQFMEAMEKLGLEEVPGEGATFDPKIHEALAVTPVPDAAQDGKVLMVYTSGYMVNGKVLQAAQVVIGKHQEPAGEA